MDKEYKAVFVDVDDTLFDFEACARQSMYRAAETMRLTLPENVGTVFQEINDGLWHRIEQGTLTRERLRTIRWNRIFEACGIVGDGPAFESLFIRGLCESTVPVPGAEELLKYLKGKYTVCIASNAFYDQQEKRLTDAGLIGYTDHLFVSERIGVNKPQKGFFEGCFRELDGIGPEDCIMIGDSLTADIAGAKAFGMDTIWFNYRKKEDLPDCADYTVTALETIREIL